MDELRLENTLGPAKGSAKAASEVEQDRDPPASEGPARKAAGPRPGPTRGSQAKGDIPDHLQRIYVPEPAKFAGFIDYFAGADAKIAAFRDHGSHLATDRTDPAIVRHLVEIAKHRGWTSLEVRGSDEFRREVWREAAAEGLKVRGYRPTERDKVSLAERGGADLGTPSRAGPPPSPADLDVGVEGRLAAAGRAPYRHQPGAKETPFVRIDQDGRSREIWGVRLPEALARSGAEVGDAVRVRRAGVDPSEPQRPDAAGGLGGSRRRANEWIIERAERFRAASPVEAAHDPELKGAQSQLQVIETLARERLKDAGGRGRVLREAKDLITEALRAGAQFKVAEVEEVRRRDLSRRSVEADARAPPERDGPERTRQR